MRPVVNVSVAPQAPARPSVGYGVFLGTVLAIGVMASLIFGVVPGAERSSPAALAVTSANAIQLD